MTGQERHHRARVFHEMSEIFPGYVLCSMGPHKPKRSATADIMVKRVTLALPVATIPLGPSLLLVTESSATGNPALYANTARAGRCFALCCCDAKLSGIEIKSLHFSLTIKEPHALPIRHSRLPCQSERWIRGSASLLGSVQEGTC